jgi:GNAT superfamily N-acetyltransferase
VTAPYVGDDVVGWAAVAPRSELPLARSRKIPQLDDLHVWSLWCVPVGPGHRRTGIVQPLLEGAVEYARDKGAPVVEGYPVDNRGERVALTTAYVGTLAMFEPGSRRSRTPAPSRGGFPRVVVRRDPR